jgi:hypothetical protein
MGIIMKTSDSIDELAAALCRAQAAMRTAPMSGTNPHLRNRYATLNDIIDTARRPLADNGLSYVQMPCNPEAIDIPFIGLTTRIMHSSGQWLETELYFPMDGGANKAVSAVQAAGSVLTYMRRYALGAALGIVADEDADGNAPPAPASAKKTAPSKPTANGQQPPERPAPFVGPQGEASDIDPLAAAIMALPQSDLAFSSATGATRFIAALTADAPRNDNRILSAADKMINARADGLAGKAAADLAVTWYKQPQPAPAQDDLFGDGDPAAKQAALATAQGQLD